MFKALTKYLLQYNRVSIPYIGSFEMVQQPAVLNIAEKVIHPPVYYCKYSTMEAIHQHQLQYLANELETDIKKMGLQLESFGKALLKEIKNRPFEWKGIGILEERNAAIIFTFDESGNNILEPVEAQKVLRDKRPHLVLVGEREVMANSAEDVGDEELEKQRYYLEIVGGAIALAALLFIIYYLYQHHYSPLSTGANVKFSPVNMAPLHK